MIRDALEMWYKGEKPIKRVLRKGTLSEAFIFLGIMLLVLGVMRFLMDLVTQSLNPEPQPFGLVFSVFMIPSQVVFGLIGIFFTAGIYFVVGRLFGSKADFLHFLKLLAYMQASASIIASVLIAFVIAFLALMVLSPVTVVLLLLLIPAAVAVVVWAIVIQVRVIKIGLGLTTGRAFLVWFIPVLVALLILAVLLFLFLVVFLAAFSSLTV